MVYRTRNDVAKNLLMIQIFFEVGAFPIIKKMTAALTCTSMDMWCAIWMLTLICRRMLDSSFGIGAGRTRGTEHCGPASWTTTSVRSQAITKIYDRTFFAEINCL